MGCVCWAKRYTRASLWSRSLQVWGKCGHAGEVWGGEECMLGKAVYVGILVKLRFAGVNMLVGERAKQCTRASGVELQITSVEGGCRREEGRRQGWEGGHVRQSFVVCYVTTLAVNAAVQL